MSDKKSFDDFSVKELRVIAVEDFAVDIMPNDDKKTVLKALEEAGIFFNDYAVEKGWVSAPAAPAAAAPVVEPVVVPDEPVTIVTQQQVVPVDNQKYLLKMDRDNVAYETCGYRFTQEHPYALVEPNAADYILRQEKGFRMAYPSELEDFYS